MSMAVSPIHVTSLPNKGRGYVASRDIKRGEVILREEAISSNKSLVELTFKFILKAAEDPSLGEICHETEIKPIRSPLPKISDAAWSKATSQVSLNAFESILHDASKLFMLLPKVSYFNHCCNPNASNLRSKSITSSVVYAIADIKEGEEVTICYAPSTLVLPTSVRKQKLSESYGFTCECSRCSDPKYDEWLLAGATEEIQAKFGCCQEKYEMYVKQPLPTTCKEASKKFEDFIAQNKLPEMNWMNIAARKCLVDTYLAAKAYYDDLKQIKSVKEIKKKLVQVIILQIKTNEQFLPQYHNEKLIDFKTLEELDKSAMPTQYIHVYNELQGMFKGEL